MPGTRFASPERWWRSGTVVLLACWIGWPAFSRPASGPREVLAGAAAVALLSLAALIPRAHLAITDEAITDRRVFRAVRIPWDQITEVTVGRPGALWGGYCVRIARSGGGTTDLLSARAYSLLPSSRNLDDLHRLASALQDSAEARRPATR